MAKQKTTFKRLVTNLPYNPSLISQVVFYSKRLKHETSIRRMGFVFIALTFLIQMFAVIAPPTATSAQDQNNDLLAGGFSSRAEAVGACTDSRKDFGTILANYGISCANVAATSVQTIRSTDYNGQLYSMGRLPYGKPGEYRVVINGRTYYMRPLRSWDSGAFSSYKALVGTSKTGARFMLLFDCGNLTVVGRPSPPPPAPVKTANCSVLLSNYAAGSVLKKGSLISLRGQVTGAYLPAGQTVRMNYDYIDLDTGKIVVGQSIHPNIAFKNGLANDPNAANYTLNTPGRYQFRLSAVMDSKDVPGSLQGRCLVNVSVEMPPIDVCPQLPGLQTDIIQCRPCKDATNNDAIACLVLSKTVSNDTTNVINADGTEAKAGDVLTYTLSTKNTGKVTVKKYVVKENISDVQDYADVVNLHGGTLSNDGTVRWPAADIKAGATITRQITVKVKTPIPQTPVSASNPGKFDLTMTNVYGNATNIKLPGSVVKVTEQVTKTLPDTGPGSNMLLAFGMTTVIGYFFFRSRLMSKELDLVRQEQSIGA